MNRYSFFTVVTGIGIIAGLVWLAGWQGNTAAAFTLGMLTAAGLMVAGTGLTLLQANIAAKREQAHFTQNAKENLAIMAAIQGVQNQQNAAVIKARNVTPANQLVIDDSIFGQLD